MGTFEEEFLPGFVWLLVNRHARMEIDSQGLTSSVGLSSHISREDIDRFPSAARLAFLAIRESFAEISSREGGTGMDQLYQILNTSYPAAPLLSAVQSAFDEHEGINHVSGQ